MNKKNVVLVISSLVIGLIIGIQIPSNAGSPCWQVSFTAGGVPVTLSYDTLSDAKSSVGGATPGSTIRKIDNCR